MVFETVALVTDQAIPWASSVLERLSVMDVSQAEQVLRFHPGHDLYIVWQSIENLLNIFKANCDDMHLYLDDFHNKARSPDFFSRLERKSFENACLQVNKCMYNLSSTSIAIFEICRRFKTKFNPDGYIENYDRIYTNNKIHHFVKGLRNALNHEYFAVAYYSLQETKDVYHTQFNLRSKELLQCSEFNQLAKKLIKESGERIEIGTIFEVYREDVLSFYEWVNIKLNEDQRFTDYQRCKLIPKQAATRVWWSIILQRLEAKQFDPFDHLEKCFSIQELDQINSFPRRSREQVDKIIELYDKNHACDNVIRQRIYKLFKV